VLTLALDGSTIGKGLFGQVINRRSGDGASLMVYVRTMDTLAEKKWRIIATYWHKQAHHRHFW
jgi:hypothetical protein